VKRILWLLVSGLMALSLVMAACAPATSPTTPTTPPTAPTPTTPAAPATPTTPPTPTQEKPQQETVTPDKPKYGGTFTYITGANIQIFGAAVSNRGSGQSGFVLEQITGVDRSRSKAGSGVSDYADGPTSFDDVFGWLAEKWTAPALGVWVLDIRRGVRFALNPDSAASRLVNGREMTAEDVAYSIEYIRDTPTSWIQLSEPLLIKGTTVERTGPWQLTVRTPVNPANGYLWLMGGGGNGYIFAKEALQKYGTSNAWQDQVGTGPFILKDFVSDSSASYIRNPGYWAKDDTGPGKGNQLPYVDAVKYLVVPDISTQLAAFRTGKADWINAVSREDGTSMLKTNPKTQYYKYISAPFQIAMRTDKKDLPYKDRKVRAALMMATDMEGIKNSIYGGEAEVMDSPARKTFTGVYTPVDQLPASTKELYKYNPDKAKQLLKEAGYPSGFKAKLVVPVVPSTAGDLAAVVKDMWAKVGVDIELQPRDASVYSGIFATRNFDDLFFGTQPGGTGALFTRYGNSYFRGPNNFNLSYVNDPEGTDQFITKTVEEVQKNVMVNYPKCEELMKTLNLYTLDQAYLIPTPAPYFFRMWQPWVKNYLGEAAAKYWLQYIWIDQDLKKAMGR